MIVLAWKLNFFVFHDFKKSPQSFDAKRQDRLIALADKTLEKRAIQILIESELNKNKNFSCPTKKNEYEYVLKEKLLVRTIKPIIMQRAEHIVGYN